MNVSTPIGCASTMCSNSPAGFVHKIGKIKTCNNVATLSAANILKYTCIDTRCILLRAQARESERTPCLRQKELVCKIPFLARAFGLKAEQPLGQAHAHDMVSCLQALNKHLNSCIRGRPGSSLKDVHTKGGVWQMWTPVLILPVKGQILRTCGEGVIKWQNFADVLYGWRLT